MSVWAAIGWGAFASASLYVGQGESAPREQRRYSARSGFSQRSIVHTGCIPIDS
jgi:hypothetical protein